MTARATTIDALRIFGFGRFAELEVELDRGLNLVVGPNEAGKSTLLAFLRSVLFGFDRRQSAQRFEPRGGFPFGGELTLKTPAGVLVVQRSGGRRRAEGELSVRDDAGTPLPPSALALALGGANRELFSQVFAITVDELQDFRALAAESSVSEALFAAGMQGAHRLPQAVATLSSQAAALWAERAQKRPLNLALSALTETRARLDAAIQRPEAYFEALAERTQLESALAAARAELDGLRARVLRFERLERAQRPMVALAGLGERRLVDDGSPEALPRFESLEARGGALARSRATLAAQAEALVVQLAAQEAASARRGSLAETRAALAGWQAVATQARGLSAREAQLLERKRALEARLARLLGRAEGAGWLGSVDAGATRVAELQALRDREARVGQERARAEDAVVGAGADCDRLETERARVLAQLDPRAPTEASVSAAITALESFSAAGLKLEQLEARRLAVRERLALSAELDGPPRGAPGAAAPALVLVALGVVVVAGVLLGRPAVGAALSFAGLVLGGVLVAVMLRARAVASAAAARRARAIAEQQRGWAAELAVLEGAIAELVLARDVLAQETGLASAELVSSRMQALGRARHVAEGQLRLGQELDQLDRARAAALQRKADAGRRLAAACAELDALREDVARVASIVGLPTGLFAQQTVDLLVELGRLQDEWSHLHRDTTSFDADARQVEVARAQLVLQATWLGLEPGIDPGILAEAVAELVASDQREQEEASQLAVRLEELRAGIARLDVESSEVAGLLAALLVAVGVPDGEVLRVRAASVLEGRAREQRRRELTLELGAASGMEPTEARRAFEEEGDVQAGLAVARASVAALEESIAASTTRLGQLTERTLAMESESLAASLRLDEMTRVAQVGKLAQEHAELALARALLQRAQQRFEQAHQPRIVKRAQGLFGELTQGRYLGLSIDVPGQSLSVRDAQGAPWQVEQLSRGTRELLLLAFRLAVVEDFGEARVRLPVILDDVLVDLDADRAERLVGLLAGLSARHQIIAMTCHRHIRQLFEGVEAHIVSLSQAVQLSLLEEQRG